MLDLVQFAALFAHKAVVLLIWAIDRQNSKKKKFSRAITGRTPRTSRSTAQHSQEQRKYSARTSRSTAQPENFRWRNQGSRLPRSEERLPKSLFRKRCHFSENSNLFWLQKLGQIMGTYKYQGSLDERRDFWHGENSREQREEDWAFIGAEGFVKIVDFQSFFYLFIFIYSPHLILCLSWILENSIHCI